ncbi:hypothetical protein D6853_11020 [Butyrivibrio sp. X503]|uniref:MptD family putative ECF transporter S component n=1 Tax=Butyrivibrio sp. X503 TaxID=2364878 RepID=UPI000EAA9E4C|nr:MptD family putative ECF transporter S component [Butyrivibrio sp. X503]RKM55251.1 hypothetical protein D6853_11020 [Butyrivibrio sp. X503]
MKMLKIKDVVMVALLTAIYFVAYMVGSSVSMVFGPFGHAISPGLCGFFTGVVFYFISRKIGKFFQYTLMQAIIMILFSIMGAGYIPWIITSMIGAFIADWIASRESKPAVWKVAIASGIFHIGQALGAIIPSIFFMESYKADWIARGQTPERMDEMIAATTGVMGILATILVFALSFAGIYLGHLILRKHFDKKEAQAA